MKSARANTEYSPLTPFRKVLPLTAAIGLLACGATVGQANDLVNANLDAVAVGPQNAATPTGWSVDAIKAVSGPFTDGCSSETWCNVQEPDGYGLFFKPFQGTVGDEISVLFYQDLPAVAGTKYTLSGYAAAEANFCGFFSTNTPAPAAVFAIEFLDAANNVIASNALDLVTAGLPNSGPGSMSLFTTPQLTAPANTATVRAGAFLLNAYGTTGSQSFFVDAFDLESEAPAGAPAITQQPSNTAVSSGSTTKFNVSISNPAGATYQWQFNGSNIADGGSILGSATSTLTITNASASDVGRYRVRITNAGGTVFSSEAALALTDINLFPVIIITGKIGDTYRVDYTTNVEPTNWIPLSTNKLTISPQMVIDTSSPLSKTRFYRTVLVP
jgi:hypothetical protein